MKLASAKGGLHRSRVEVILARAQNAIDRNQSRSAVRMLDGFIQDNPNEAQAMLLMGKAMLRTGRPSDAVNMLRRAQVFRPSHAETLSALGIALSMVGEISQALAISGEAFQIEPKHETAVNFSHVLLKSGDYEGVLCLSTYALRRHAESVLALKNRAVALTGLGRYDEAIQDWRIILACLPNDSDTHHSLASLLLQCGRMTPETWAIYERRVDWTALAPKLKRWDGVETGRQTILLHAEQGLGDTLQFVRYVPLVAALGHRVILSVQPCLVKLLANTLGADKVLALGSPLPKFDAYCPLMSLPAIFNTNLASIPPAMSYGVPEAHREPGYLHVGLVWSGNPDFAYDSERSIPYDLLECLSGVSNVKYYNLQYGAQQLPTGLEIIPTLDGVTDLLETAQRVAALDLVITVDTAMAHLAATMGKPVWLLSRFLGCWRWLNNRTDTPWYPSMRIIRQSRPGDWTSVLDRVRHDLAEVTGKLAQSRIAT